MMHLNSIEYKGLTIEVGIVEVSDEGNATVLFRCGGVTCTLLIENYKENRLLSSSLNNLSPKFYEQLPDGLRLSVEYGDRLQMEIASALDDVYKRRYVQLPDDLRLLADIRHSAMLLG